MDGYEENADALMRVGFEMVEAGEFERAMEVAGQLKGMRHSSHFEISALAYQAQGREREAVSVLEEGVREAPRAWRLWELLGNLYSDAGDFDRAQGCYRSALEQPTADRGVVALNSAIAYNRQQKFAAALEALREITDGELLLKAAGQMITALSYVEGPAAAEDFANNLMESELWTPERYPPEDLSYVFSALAGVYWQSGQGDKAAEQVWQAIELFKANEQAAWLIREMEGRYADGCRYFRLLLQGVWDAPADEEDPDAGSPFYTKYDVVAEDEAEALELAKRFEPEGVRDSLRIVETEVLNTAPDQPKGVYFTWDYYFFPAEE